MPRVGMKNWLNTEYSMLRRAFTIPLMIGGTFLYTAISPLLFMAACVRDLFGDRKLPTARSVLFFLLYCWVETGFMLGYALPIWMWSLASGNRDSPHWLQAVNRMQSRWGSALLLGGARVFSMGIRIEGLDRCRKDRPLLVLVRHVSTVDTMLPLVLLGRRGWVIRYVLKAELLLDPCVDINGKWLSYCFIRRGSGVAEAEIQHMLHCQKKLQPGEALAIFPEGTRFTPSKRKSLIGKLKGKGNTEHLQFAESLNNTLSPIRPGTLALLCQRGNADVVVVAHRGLDCATSLADLASGLLGGLLEVRMAFFPNEEVPVEHNQVEVWLMDVWRGVDRFVGERYPAKGENA